VQARTFAVFLKTVHVYSVHVPPSCPAAAHSAFVLQVTNSPKSLPHSFVAWQLVPPPNADAQQTSPVLQSAASSHASFAPKHFVPEFAMQPASSCVWQQSSVAELHSFVPHVTLFGFEATGPPDEVLLPSVPPSVAPPLDEVEDPPPLDVDDPPDEEAAPDDPPDDAAPPPSPSAATGVSSSPPQPVIAPATPHAKSEPPLMIKT
jgi:hypothetical protein